MEGDFKMGTIPISFWSNKSFSPEKVGLERRKKNEE